MIPRPCLGCGRPTTAGSRCERCAAPIEASRQRRQFYRAAYVSPEYKRARKARKAMADDQCEALLADGTRCPHVGQEAHHVIALATATSLPEAIALCAVENLRWVCWRHNPRGQERTRLRDIVTNTRVRNSL